MNDPTLKRRDFHRLTAAAFGGLLAGTGSAFAQDAKPKAREDDKPKHNVDVDHLLKEPHVCRGLNTCETKGKGGENACAGQGNCAAVKAHSCNGMNDCAGQGGCGGYPGQNTCKGKGHCAVPLSKTTWAIARKQFEHLMGEVDKKIGKAPAAG
ncbi:MAG: hypothetical protein KY476_04505 [Planctomycetes bacterium]|nr:hypothetical protein [Planctomycetota bacterium]